MVEKKSPWASNGRQATPVVRDEEADGQTQNPWAEKIIAAVRDEEADVEHLLKTTTRVQEDGWIQNH